MGTTKELIESCGVDVFYHDAAADISIVCGDCLEVLKAIPPESIDLFFTSPPYNLSQTTGGGFNRMRYSGSKWNNAKLADGYADCQDRMAYPEYVEWQRNCLTAMWWAKKRDGAIFYNHKPRVQLKKLQLPFFNAALPLRQIIIWARAGGINYSPSHYVPTCEWVMVFASEKFELKSKGASGVGDVWYIPQDDKSSHPAPFPIELPHRAIETTKPGLVCDPFSGYATTAVAAKRLSRPCICIEQSREYCEEGKTRLKNEPMPMFVEPREPERQAELFNV